MRIAVVGAGVLGLFAALELRRREPGAEIVILDAGGPAASEGSLAWLNVSTAEDRGYAALRREAMDGWADLVGTTGAPVPWQGALMWHDDPARTEADIARCREIGWPVEALDAEAFRRHAPGIAVPPELALFAPREGASLPAEIMGWLASRIARAGLEVTRADVAALDASGGRLKGLRLKDGTAIGVDAAILATGAATPALLNTVGLDLALRPGPGLLMITGPAAPVAGPVLASPQMDFWQHRSGRFVIATSWDRTLDVAPEAAQAEALETLARLAPAAAGVRPEQVLVRERPIPADGFSAVGAVDGIAGLVLCVSHSGMTLGPALGRMAAEAALGRPGPADARWLLERLLRSA